MGRDTRSGAAFLTADKLAETVCRLVESWQAHPRQTLGGQLCRAAISVAANLVESTSRASARERLRFVEIADGSLREAGYLVDLATRVGLFAPAEREQLGALHTSAAAALARRRSNAASTARRQGRRAR